MARKSLFLVFCLLVGSLAQDKLVDVEAEETFVDTNPLYNNGIVPKDLEDGFLPHNLDPIHYDLEIRPNIYTGAPPFTNNGHVHITFHVDEPTNQIVLNYRGLTIVEGSLDLESVDGSPAPSVLGYGVLPDVQALIVTLSGDLDDEEDYIFSVSFFSTLNSASGRYGLYYDTYEQDEEIRYVVGSQLQTTHARRVFPVFDEPDFKATFDVTIGRQASHHAIGNGVLEESEEVENGWILDHFDTTPEMSPYLLAFVVVDFHYLETVTPAGTICRLWVRDDAIEAADFGLEVIGPVTHWLGTYTNFRNVIPIVDHVLMPNHGGAMENWGLIIYGERTVLWDEDWFGATERRGTGTIIAHELAHFWFGNLVTCESWSDAWLNEGFASFFENKALESIGWDSDDLIYQRRVRVMLGLDIDGDVQPLRPNVTTIFESGLGFTSTSYSKGASILRMLEAILSPAAFQRAIQRYIVNFQYSNAHTDDLFAVMTQQADQEGITNPDGSPLIFKDKFDPWVYQRGYPLIRAIRNYDTEELTLSQSHFDPHDEHWPESEYNYFWNVPIAVINEDDGDVTLDAWLDRVPAIVLDGQMPSDDSEWYLVNPGAHYFYRVQYDRQNMENLVDQLQEDHEVFDSDTRAAIIEDTFTLARDEILSEVDAWETILYLDEEDEGVPWLTFDSYQHYAHKILERFDETEELLEHFMEHLVDSVYEEMGWEIDYEQDIYNVKLQQLIVHYACLYDNYACTNDTMELWEDWLELPADQNPVDVTHRPTFYCTVIEEGDEDEWDSIYERYKEDSGFHHLPFDEVEKHNLLFALSCSENVTLLEEYLENLFVDDYVDDADVELAMVWLADSEDGRDVVWHHLVDHWRDEDCVPEGVNKELILDTVVSGFASEQDQLEFTNFVAKYPPEDEEEEEIFDEAAEIVARNRRWAERNVDALHQWFLEHIGDDE
jgi:aminopeptidase N